MTARSLLVLSYFWQVVLGDSFYDTPQANDQFKNFTITNAIPSGGSTKGGDIQDAVNISPHYIIFEFKGEGNALILFQEDESNETANVCMVEIGGGDLLRRNAVYTSKDLASTPVGQGSKSYITSKDEFRPFWIKWLEGRTNIYIGRSLIVGDSQILSTGNAVFFDIAAVSISTTSANNGSWRFHAVSTSTTPQSKVTSTEDKTSVYTVMYTSSDTSVATESPSLTSTTILPTFPTSTPTQTEQTTVSSISMPSTSKDIMSSVWPFYISSTVSNTVSPLVTATSPTSTPSQTEQTAVSSTSISSTSKDTMSSLPPLHISSTVSNTTESKTESSLVTVTLTSMNATSTTPEILAPTSIPRRPLCVPSQGTVVHSNNNTNPSFIVLFLSWIFLSLK